MQTKICPQCETTNFASNRTCKNCQYSFSGSTIHRSAPPNAPPHLFSPPAEPEHRPVFRQPASGAINPMFALLGLVALALIGYGIYYYANIPPAETELETKIFVVTQGAENFKLGLVPVAFYKIDKTGAETLANGGRTDADGRLVIKLPKGSYTVKAESQRRTFKEREKYYWNEKINLTEDKQQLVLSNDTVVTTRVDNEEE